MSSSAASPLIWLNHSHCFPLHRQSRYTNLTASLAVRIQERIPKNKCILHVDCQEKVPTHPRYMAERGEFKTYYEPEIISIGPIHHLRKEQLLPGERYKEAWAAMYLKETNQTAKDLYWRLLECIPELLNQLAELLEEDIPGDRGEYLAWMLVVDGCSVLYLLDNTDPYLSDEKLKISMGKLIRVHQDVVILDNQIPFQVLRLLCDGGDKRRLERCLQNFLRVYGVDRIPRLSKQKHTGKEAAQEVKIIVQGEDDDDDDDPIHLLDCLRRAFLDERLLEIVKGYNQERRASDDVHLVQGLYRMLHLRKYRIGTIRELKAAGIHVKSILATPILSTRASAMGY